MQVMAALDQMPGTASISVSQYRSIHVRRLGGPASAAAPGGMSAPELTQRSAGDNRALESAVLQLAAVGLAVGAARLTPHAQRWWKDTVRPMIAAQRLKLEERRTIRQLQAAPPLVIEGTVHDASAEEPTGTGDEGVDVTELSPEQVRELIEQMPREELERILRGLLTGSEDAPSD